MTAEERMRSLLADVLDAMHESALRDEGRNAIHRCDIEAAMKMLALEGEQGEPAKDQRGAPDDAAMPNKNSEHIGAKQPSGSDNNVIHPATAPHHHSRPEQFEWVEIGFNARLDAEPAPAREPSAEVTARNVADGAESADLLTPSRVRAMAIAFDRLRAENEKLKASLYEEIQLRPHWAKGYSSDSVAAQCADAAIRQLWELLGAKDQTEAVMKLKGGVVVPRGVANALLEWSGAEPSQSVLSRAVDDWINASQEPKHG